MRQDLAERAKLSRLLQSRVRRARRGLAAQLRARAAAARPHRRTRDDDERRAIYGHLSAPRPSGDERRSPRPQAWPVDDLLERPGLVDGPLGRPLALLWDRTATRQLTRLVLY